MKNSLLAKVSTIFKIKNIFFFSPEKEKGYISRGKDGKHFISYSPSLSKRKETSVLEFLKLG
jgi:hypothetical protein